MLHTRPIPTRLLSVALLAMALLAGPSVAAQAPETNNNFLLRKRVQTLIPAIEKYAESGMRDFDVPGLAIGIVVGDELVYGKGFGVRAKSNRAPVDSRTVFQIGSTTKAFLATTVAIAVDRGQLRWDDRVIDLYPDFQLKDPRVTREFRVFDLMAQRSGLPPYVNDMMGSKYAYDEEASIRALRYVEPTSRFRSTFTYTNVTHLLTGRIVAKAADAANWYKVLQQEIFEPLGMKSSSYSAAALNAAPNHAEGHRYTPKGSIQVPTTQITPYAAAVGAGAINSNIENMSRWIRLQLGNGSFEGRRIVSPKNLTFTRTPKVRINDKDSYAYGWVVGQSPNGAIVAHDGSTDGFGAFVALQLDRKIGVVILTNQVNVGFPDALGKWTINRLLNNPSDDYVAASLKKARADDAKQRQTFARPSSSRPTPPLGPFVGNYSNPSFGKVALSVQGNSLILKLKATGAQIKLDPWDGNVFTINQVPNGKFADVVKNEGPLPSGFGQLQMDPQGKPNLLKLTYTDNGQVFKFQREVDSAGAKPPGVP